MSHPLLALDHDWHRQRAQLRTGRLRPPPLVAAGIDLAHEPSTGRRVVLGGLAVIFGVFPARLAEFLDLARARLHLGAGQARELDPVLNTRILAMWAWLPTLRQDCYLELDRATGEEHIWQVGPGPGDTVELNPEEEHPALDAAFLDAVVLNGPGHWGGEGGLARLVERFGHRSLLVAAQVADLLDHHPQEPQRALAVAHHRWPDLTADDETAWAPLADREHPWTSVQLGRLALRLGLVRAARLLLRLGQQTEVAPIAHFDLGQACEILGDLTAAEAAFARYAAVRPTDPDAWRRLLLCRLRLGHFTVAEETLKRYRAAGGRERDLAERFLSLMIRPTAQGQQRINLVGWLCARLPEAFRRRLPISGLVNEIILRRCDSLTITDSARLAAATQGLRAELQCAPATVPENRLDDALRVALLCLPLLPRPRESAPPAAAGSDPAAVLALQALAAISLWATLTGIPAQRLGEMEDSVNLRDLAHFALTARPAPPHPLP